MTLLPSLARFRICSGDSTVALKDLQILNLRPADKVAQYTDDRGLYLEVHPSGPKLWRYK